MNRIIIQSDWDSMTRLSNFDRRESTFFLLDLLYENPFFFILSKETFWIQYKSSNGIKTPPFVIFRFFCFLLPNIM